MTSREEAHAAIDAIFDHEMRAVIVLFAPTDWTAAQAHRWRDIVQRALDENRGLLIDSDGVKVDLGQGVYARHTVDFGEAALSLQRERDTLRSNT